jgi:hypothetical protein
MGLRANLDTKIHVHASAAPNPIVVERKIHAHIRAALPGFPDFAI